MIVDWLSFTLLTEPDTSGKFELLELIQALPRLIREQNPALKTAVDELGPTLEPATARAPYSIAWNSKRGLSIMYNPSLPHMLIEFSGRGCKILREMGITESVIEHAAGRMTRIDIAQDIPDVTPSEIVEVGYSSRFRTHSEIISDTGHTYYVGSVKSERYARVYRYAPPHERAHLCRVETVYRKQYAKILARNISSEGLEMAAKKAMGSFEFGHPAVGADGKLETVQIEKASTNTVRWLQTQVAPAFKRLVDEGIIQDPETFVRDWFLAE